MSALEAAAQQLVTTVAAGKFSREEVMRAGQALFDAVGGASGEELDNALECLLSNADRLSIGRAASLVYACAGLAKHGADTEVERVGRAIIGITGAALALATMFIEACRTRAQDVDPTLTIKEAVQRYAQEIGDKQPENGEAWWAIDMLTRVCLALLCRSKAVRKTARADKAFTSNIQSYPDETHFIEHLQEMLKILDDERLIVLHPDLIRGYAIRIAGLVSNFQLHTLLEDAVIGDPVEGWLPGQRPSPEAVAIAKDTPSDDPPRVDGVFNLVNWHGLLPDQTVPADHRHGESKHWIWNEGVPADIDPFEGTRIVLLGMPPYGRSWSTGRGSPYPIGELEVVEQLPTSDVEDWLERIAAAAKAWAEHEEPR